MKVPFEWLKEYVPVNVSPEELAEKLTMAGSEVGAIEYHGTSFQGVVVGKIKAVEKTDGHLICKIDIGDEIIQILTDDLSLQVGDRVPVARDNSILEEGIKINKISLRGIESFGMLCRPHELGLGSAEHVLKLPLQAKVGEDVRRVIGKADVILDIDVLPNRGDLHSIIGVARETAAVLDAKLKIEKTEVKESDRKINAEVSVQEKNLCPRYTARAIKEIKIKDSPKWLSDRLLQCGLRPINNIVDITNYILLECGQPLHAFDLDKVDKIIVRSAKEGEKIKTIDEVERKLDPSMLIIADSLRPIAVAGIMGGLDTAVSPGTKNILLESACFDPISINKTSQALKLRTESSVRFGKGVDYAGVEAALDKAAKLMAELGEGYVLCGKIDLQKEEREPKTIILRVERVRQILGKELTTREIKGILERLGFKILGETAKKLNVEIPFFRAGDIEREIDLIEETARIYGYEKIEPSLPWVSQEMETSRLDLLCQKIREVMIGAGLYETQTFSILDPQFPGRLGLKEDFLRDCLKITNPLTEEESVLRTFLIPSLLKVLDYNLRHQIEKLRIFEVNKVFRKEGEKLMLGGVLYGAGVDFYYLKGIISILLSEFGSHKVQSIESSFLHPGKSAGIVFSDRAAGYFGVLHPDAAKKYEFPGEVFIFEISVDALLSGFNRSKKFRPLPKFPKAERDVSMIVGDSVAHLLIVEAVKRAGGNMVEKVKLFDTYKNSRAYRITYRDKNRTLTDEDVNAKHEEICQALAAQLGVELRR